MLDEEVHLPGELLHIERNAVGKVLRRLELRAALLDRGDESHGLAVEGGVFPGRRGAEMGLQRDVAEILQCEDAEIFRVP